MTAAWSTYDDPVTTVPSDWHPLAGADDHGLTDAVRLDRTDGFTTVASDQRFLRHERHRADQHERVDDGFIVRGSAVTVATASISPSARAFSGIAVTVGECGNTEITYRVGGESCTRSHTVNT